MEGQSFLHSHVRRFPDSYAGSPGGIGLAVGDGSSMEDHEEL